MDELSPTEVEALSKVMGNSVLSEYKQKDNSDNDDGKNHPSLHYQGEQIYATQAQFIQLKETENLDPSDNLQDLKLHVEVILGHTKLPLKEILALQSGNILPLDKLAGEPVDLVANGKVIAKAEVVVVEDNFAIRIIEILP